MKKMLIVFVTMVIAVVCVERCFAATVQTPMIQDLDGNAYDITNINEIIAEAIVAVDIITRSPWADVRAFGAKGDNVTDDTTAIQNAINTGAGCIFIPEGIFRVSGITLGANQTLCGVGMKSQIKLLAGYPNAKILSVHGNNAMVQNLYINNEDNAPQSLFGIAIEEGSCSARIMNVKISGAANGLFLSNAAGATAANLSISDCTVSGIRLYGAVNSCSFINSVISDCAVGIYATGAISHNSFQNITAEFCSQFGFWFQGGYFNTFAGCTAYQNNQHGFKISHAAQRNTFEGCIALENSTEAAGSYCGFLIMSENTERNIISGCIATDSRGANATQQYGICIVAPASENLITGNTLSPNMVGALYESGQTETNVGHNYTGDTLEKHSGFSATGYISLLATNGNVGSFSFTAASSVSVSNISVTADSKVFLSPTSASAANLVSGSKSPYISVLTPGVGFTVSTADSTAATGTESFNYIIFN